MCSFRNARRLLVDAYDDDIIDEDEFVLLYRTNTSKNLDFPYKECGQFDLNELDSAECKAEFRFENHDIELLAQVLDIPDRFVCNQGTVCDGIEGLCIAMRRFAYPCRYSDMIHRFGRPVPELSMICSLVNDFIFDTHGHRITQWNDAILNPINLQRYADAIHNKGAAPENCIGFIDGTVRPICRPGVLQRIVYNGHKRVHALKFQSVTLPNGIIAHMYGPVGMYILIVIS